MTNSIPPGTKGWNVPNNIVIPQPNTRAKVNFQPAKFDALVNQQGVRVRVFRTTFCPNVKSIDGAEHEIDCPLCHGVGFVDCMPVDTWAVLQNQELEKKAFAEGMYDANTVMATFMQGVSLQYFTLVELPDHPELFFERVKRQQGNLDVLKYPALQTYFVVDSHGKNYYEGSDYQLDVNGNVKWCPNMGPSPSTIYSINYDTKIRFRAIRAAHVNRFVQVTAEGQTTTVRMNEEWILQKEFLVVRKDIDGNLIKPNKIRDSDTV